jgi:hypothetical protein
LNSPHIGGKAAGRRLEYAHEDCLEQARKNMQPVAMTLMTLTPDLIAALEGAA